MRKRSNEDETESTGTPKTLRYDDDDGTCLENHNHTTSAGKMDARNRSELETTVDARLQSHIIQKYEEEIHRLQSVVTEKDEVVAEKNEQILKLTRENAELSTKLQVQENILSFQTRLDKVDALVSVHDKAIVSVQENVLGGMQTRLDKVDALVSVHDKAIVSVKDNIQGLTYRLANLPLEPKDGRKIQQLPMPSFTQQPSRTQFAPMVNTTPTDPVSITLVGDATFKYIDEEHLFSKMAKCNKVIVNSIDEAKTVITDVLTDQPTCLVFHLGTRDIEYSNSDVCAHKMQECVRLVKDVNPEIQLCISLLLPRGDSEPNKVKAQLFNFKVQELLAHEGVQFIIHSEMEKDGRLITKYYQPDFININGLDGSRKLAAHLKHGIRRAVPSLQPQPIQGSF